MMGMKLEHASVVLTGAAGGIGAPTARALFAAGARLLLVGRHAGRLAALMRSLDPQAGDRSRVDVLAVDIGTPAGIEAVRSVALARHVNVLINNAGLASFGRLGALDEAHILQAVTTNLVAPMLLTRALLPGLQDQPAAAVLNVGSVLGRLALPGFSVYSATKFGLRGFSEALRRELAGTKVRVQYFGPRVTQTGFNSPEVEAYNQETGAGTDPPEVVAAALLTLLRSGAAERFLGVPEKYAVRVNGLAPAALDAAFKRHRLALPDA
ncbi:SDR family oxidoreductase [Methylibium sp.]|uniref:SDR family oxidoreductase n=1 Tax=Methylibium sp. TaxID=2067992 RepID=UPI003D11EE46